MHSEPSTARVPHSLEPFRDRTLALLASSLAGRPCRFVRCQRLEDPLVVAVGTQTIFADDRRCTPYAFIHAARFLGVLLQRELPEGEVPSATVIESGLREVDVEFAKRWPAVGTWDMMRPTQAPRVTWDRVRMHELEPGDTAGPIELLDTSGHEIDGAGGDLDALLRSIRAGETPSRQHPDLPGVEIVDATLGIPAPVLSSEEHRRLDELLPDAREKARAAAQCIRDRATGTQRVVTGALRRRHGVKLDWTRLHLIPIAAQRGRSPAVFRRPRRELVRQFEAHRNVGTVGIDLNSLRPGSLGDPAMPLRALLYLIHTLAELNVRFQVIGFADALLPSGRQGRRYLHLQVPLKDPDEPMGRVVLERLMHAARTGRSAFGEPAVAHSLQFETLCGAARTLVGQTAHADCISLFYVAMRKPSEELTAAGQLERTAEHAERVFQALIAEPGVSVTPLLILPSVLLAEAPSGGALAKSIGV